MYHLLQILLQNVNNGSSLYSDSMPLWEIILMLLGAAILGYLLCYFSKKKPVPDKTLAKTTAPIAPQVNEWELKYKNFQANYDQNKQEWLQKSKSSEDRAKTYQSQLADIKLQHEKAGIEKMEFVSKLRAMEAQRNEALESVKKIKAELLGAAENIKTQQEKISSLSSALAMASNIKRETPKTIVISDEELTKKYDTETAFLKKQLEEKDKRVINLLSKEAAANELQQRNDKLASENKILRTEMSTANLDTEAVIEKAQQLKDLQLQVLSLSNKIALANGETATLKKQLAEQQKRHHQQAGKLNELRMSIGQERNAMKAKITALENELAPFKPSPIIITIPENEQKIKPVDAVVEAEKVAPVVEQTVTDSPKIDVTPIVVDVTSPILEQETPENEPLMTDKRPTAEAFTSPTVIETGDKVIGSNANTFPPDEKGKIEITEPTIFPVDTNKITIAEPSNETPAGKQNDLLLVQGITPAVKTLLEAEGISSWAKLAKTSADSLKALLSEKASDDTQLQNINPKSWPIQAQLLTDGKWEAFASYTRYLIGGVDPEEVKA